MMCMTEVYGNSAVATPDGKSRKKKKRKQTGLLITITEEPHYYGYSQDWA